MFVGVISVLNNPHSLSVNQRYTTNGVASTNQRQGAAKCGRQKRRKESEFEDFSFFVRAQKPLGRIPLNYARNAPQYSQIPENFKCSE